MTIPLPSRRPFTVEEYYRMAEAGILRAEERVELIEGEVIQMAAIGSRHGGTVKRLNRLLTHGLGDHATVQIQDPVRLNDISEPEPDVAVLLPRPDDYTSAHPVPADVLLIIEIADTSIGFDRRRKAWLYARSGIADFWLVDLTADTIEVYRSASPDGYRDSHVYRRGDSLAPAAFPDLVLPVDLILPPLLPVS